MTSAAQGVSANRQLAEAALSIFVNRESQAQVEAMKNVQQEVTDKVSIILGNSQWARGDLFDYFYVRDVIGASQLGQYLPELVETFTDRYRVLQQWRQEVGNVSAALEASPAIEASLRAALTEWMNMDSLLAAVHVAEEHLEEMLAH